METWILIVLITVIVVVIIVLLLLFLTAYCYNVIYKRHRSKAQKHRYRYLPLPQEVDIELESHTSGAHSTISYRHSTELSDTQLSSSPSSSSQDYGGHSEITEIQGAQLGEQNLHISVPHDTQDAVEGKQQTKTLPGPVLNRVQNREAFALPESIRTYVVDSLIPSFMDQRAGNQFAVVLLLSETDYQNINEVKLSPSDINGKPKIDNSQRALPQRTELYCNYIVARPTISEGIHSEREIFDIGSTECSNNSRFNELWDAYCCQHKQVHPKYILIYSWNLPCENCTDLIIKSLQRSPYNSAVVIVVYTCVWREEDTPQRQRSKERMISQGIFVEEVAYPKFISKSFVR